MKTLLENWQNYIDEAADPCWDGYRKQGMKKKGDKMVPNCVPLEEEVIEEKDDRCTRIAKRKYDVWPSAYASGAVVRCRAGKIWKDVKEDISDEQLDENTEYEDLEEAKKKKAGTESSKESSLRDWFGRKGAKGKKGGWVDCNAPDGKGGYKACGREKGEKLFRYVGGNRCKS